MENHFFFMGKSTISMAIFNSYFDRTRGYQIMSNDVTINSLQMIHSWGNSFVVSPGRFQALPMTDCRGLKWGGELTEAGINDAEARLNFGDGVCSFASSKTHAYHLVMTNIAMENPNHKWRFLAGKIIYKWAIFHGKLLNNQRVYPKCSRFQSIQPPENAHEVC